MREIGYYWVYGNKCFIHYEKYMSYWDGHSFWIDGDDFNEDVFQIINERKIY
jgi:hypothetical protein